MFKRLRVRFIALSMASLLLVLGVILGAVYGVVFRQNASTGGIDIVSKYITTKAPELNFFWIACPFTYLYRVRSCVPRTRI